MNNIEAVLLESVNEFVGFARKRLGDPELAADVVQESLLKALKAADQVRNPRKARRPGSTVFSGGPSLIFIAAVTRARRPLPNTNMN